MRKTSGLISAVLTILWASVGIPFTSKVEMKGMPMEMPAVKTTMCLNSKDTVPQKPEKNQDCKMISNKIEGSTVTWVMQCRDKKGNTIDSSGSITYKVASFDGPEARSNALFQPPEAVEGISFVFRASSRQIA